MKDERRRRAIQALAFGAPAAWGKPVVDSVLLPAHASTSLCRVDVSIVLENPTSSWRWLIVIRVNDGPPSDWEQDSGSEGPDVSIQRTLPEGVTEVWLDASGGITTLTMACCESQLVESNDLNNNSATLCATVNPCSLTEIQGCF